MNPRKARSGLGLAVSLLDLLAFGCSPEPQDPHGRGQADAAATETKVHDDAPD